MKTKIYANIVKSGKVIKSACIGSAILNDDRIKARKYNELMRCAKKEFPEKKKRSVHDIGHRRWERMQFRRIYLPFPVCSFS